MGQYICFYNKLSDVIKDLPIKKFKNLLNANYIKIGIIKYPKTWKLKKHGNSRSSYSYLLFVVKLYIK